MRTLIADIDRLLTAGQALVLARIVRLVGSAPRQVGAACIVCADGSLLGTIGGGLLEFEVVARAKQMLAEGAGSAMVEYRMTGKALEASEMLCGGVADVYLERLAPDNPATREVFAAAARLAAGDARGTLVTRMAAGLAADDARARVLLCSGRAAAGGLPGLPEDMSDLTQKRHARQETLGDGGMTVFVETIAAEDRLILFGAGHVAACVAEVAGRVGFGITVVDDRAEFANAERFPMADDIVVAPFDGVMERLAVTRNSFLVIVTRGHAHDYTVLKQALATRAGYVGMIGSRTKRRTIYNKLLEEGVTQEQLDAVHSPIGLRIGAETPEEIAISIVGEMIAVRAAL